MAKKEAKEDNELAIDFSKVLGIFRKKPAKTGKSSHAHEHSEHAEYNHDAPESHESRIESEEKEEFSIDAKKLWGSVYRYRIVLLILIPIILSIFFRMQTMYLPQTDSWAESSVQNYYKSQIAAQVDQQYPNLPAENKNTIIDQELQKYISAHKTEYDQQVTSVSQNFKSYFQDETGQPYLIELDCYQWYRYGRDIIDHGYMGDKKVGSQVYDMHMIAPIGRPISQELAPYVGAYLYKIINPITGTNLMGAFFIIPIVIMALAVIPAFLIGRRLGGDIGGFFTATLVAIHPAILSRTMGGAPDTDPYTVFFPLLIFWLVIEAFESEKISTKAIYASLAGISTGIFAFAWSGWWYIFDFVIAMIGLYLAYYIISEYFVRKKKLLDNIKNDMKARNLVIMLVLYIVLSSIFVPIFVGFNSLGGAVFNPLSFVTIKEAAKTNLWPNVYTTVAEMNASTISSTIESMGGKVMFLIGLLGIFMLLLKNQKGERKVEYFILLTLWFAGAIYATTKGIRFTLILAPAYTIGFGFAVSWVYENASRWVSKEMNIGMTLTKIALVILLCMLLIPTLKVAKATSVGEMSMMNDAWYSSLQKIDKEASKDAIINSWWDYGHWFKALADRAVTFDGASQNRPQAHWIGKVLLTSNEEEAIGILRMLDCGANSAFDVLDKDMGNMHESVDLLYRIIVMDKENAKKELLKYVSAEKADQILKYTHCAPPEDYFITSEDMVGKAGVWAHFGSWDFERAEIWREFRDLPLQDAVSKMMNEFNYTKDYAEKLYYEVQAISNEQEANNWISPWPGYITATACSKEDNSTVVCAFSLQGQTVPIEVNTKTEEAFIETTKGIVYPYSLAYIDSSGQFREKKYSNTTMPYSMALINNAQGVQGILMSPELASSMFTRLFYFNATGLRHFDQFEYQRDVTGQDIYIWKVDWEGKK